MCLDPTESLAMDDDDKAHQETKSLKDPVTIDTSTDSSDSNEKDEPQEEGIEMVDTDKDSNDDEDLSDFYDEGSGDDDEGLSATDRDYIK